MRQSTHPAIGPASTWSSRPTAATPTSRRLPSKRTAGATRTWCSPAGASSASPDAGCSRSRPTSSRGQRSLQLRLPPRTQLAIEPPRQRNAETPPDLRPLGHAGGEQIAARDREPHVAQVVEPRARLLLRAERTRQRDGLDRPAPRRGGDLA